ncbi:MAG TPA: dihydroneopterin aldolase [Hyphomicrobiaceae bacterium]|jgi:dihydroneopterin aldolase|nr:dihydroneopterin aldolase [Hyphomicrobiaceae bacterium]
MTPAVKLRRVFVRDLEVMGRVGIYEVERRYDQRILVSVDLEVADTYDGVSDRLRDVLDYEKLVERVRSIVEADHVNLLETLAERIAQACFADIRVHTLRVRIEKPDILPGCRSVGIEIERTRPQS